jgi:hypothetical protein
MADYEYVAKYKVEFAKEKKYEVTKNQKDVQVETDPILDTNK